MRIVLLISLSVLVFSCQRQRYTLAQLPPTYLVYGQGGGYVGQETATYLFSNGQQFQIEHLNRDTVDQPSVKRREARALFAQADSLFQQLGEVKAPGNTYQFVRYHTPDTSYQASWGATDYTPPAAVLRLYRQLRAEK